MLVIKKFSALQCIHCTHSICTTDFRTGLHIRRVFVYITYMQDTLHCYCYVP